MEIDNRFLLAVCCHSEWWLLRLNHQCNIYPMHYFLKTKLNVLPVRCAKSGKTGPVTDNWTPVPIKANNKRIDSLQRPSFKFILSNVDFQWLTAVSKGQNLHICGINNLLRVSKYEQTFKNQSNAALVAWPDRRRLQNYSSDKSVVLYYSYW